MICLRFALFILLTLSGLQASAQATRLNAAEDYAEDDWGLTFGASYSSRVLVHNESSSNTSYSTSGRRVRVPDVSMSVSLMKEFLNPNRISITAVLLGGISDSSGNSGGESIATFEEKLDSSHFGGALSVNYNIYAYGLKLQTYLGARFLSEQGELNLAHSNGGTNLNTIHRFDAQVLHLGLGLRAFDADHNLMSYFEISTPNTMSENFTPIGQVNGTDVTITSETKITRDPVAFSMGFGYYF